MELVDALAGLGRAHRSIRTAKVVSTSPFTVSLYEDSDAVSAARLASYTPTVGDRVLLLTDQTGTSVVLGKVIAADLTGAIDVPSRRYT